MLALKTDMIMLAILPSLLDSPHPHMIVSPNVRPSALASDLDILKAMAHVRFAQL